MTTPQPGIDDPTDETGRVDEDTRDLLERLRAAPAEQVLMDLFSTLLSTAQVKLGRRDARLFIDMCAATLEHAGRYVSDDHRAQVEVALGQLRMGQVSAESEIARSGKNEPNDLERTPASPSSGSAPRARPRHDEAPRPSTLWVPGQ